MGKLIELIDNKTLDPIYPTTHTDFVLDNKGGNIASFVDKEINELNESTVSKINKIINSNNIIKTLKNKQEPTVEEIKISTEIILIEDNKNKISELNLISDTVHKKIYKSITDQDLYDGVDIIEILDNIDNFAEFIEYGTPTTAPGRKRLMIDEENLYIGLLNKWYVVNTYSSRIDLIIFDDNIADVVGKSLIVYKSKIVDKNLIVNLED